MRRIQLSTVEGVRWQPDAPTGVGALLLAGSSGRVDSARAELLARHGVTAESIRWFGGDGQHDGPWEIPLELFSDRVEALSRDCDRVMVWGTSFGAEAALLTGSLDSRVAAVVAFAPSDVVWAGVRSDGTVTSHWTRDGVPVPYSPLDPDWQKDSDPPAYLDCYEASRLRYADEATRAAIPVERIRELVLVAGGDDRVWPALPMARSIEARRSALGLGTVLVSDPDAGHRAVLPGEEPVTGGAAIQRGGSDGADRRLGASAWEHILPLLQPR